MEGGYKRHLCTICRCYNSPLLRKAAFNRFRSRSFGGSCMHAPQPKPDTAWRSRAYLAGMLSWNSPDATTWLTADVSPLYLLKKATFIFLQAFLFGVVYP